MLFAQRSVKAAQLLLPAFQHHSLTHRFQHSTARIHIQTLQHPLTHPPTHSLTHSNTHTFQEKKFFFCLKHTVCKSKIQRQVVLQGEQTLKGGGGEKKKKKKKKKMHTCVLFHEDTLATNQGLEFELFSSWELTAAHDQTHNEPGVP